METKKDVNEEKEFMQCPFCGGELKIGLCEKACEVSDDYNGDEEALVRYFSCDTCGRDFEVYDPVKSERDDVYAEYWHEDEEDEEEVRVVIPVNKSFAAELICLYDERVLRDLKIDAATGNVHAILSDGDVEIFTGDYLVLTDRGNWKVMSEKKEG